jgi:hypothetical protein
MYAVARVLPVLLLALAPAFAASQHVPPAYAVLAAGEAVVHGGGDACSNEAYTVAFVAAGTPAPGAQWPVLSSYRLVAYDDAPSEAGESMAWHQDWVERGLESRLTEEAAMELVDYHFACAWSWTYDACTFDAPVPSRVECVGAVGCCGIRTWLQIDDGRLEATFGTPWNVLIRVEGPVAWLAGGVAG